MTREIRLGDKELRGFRAYREGWAVYVQIEGYRPVYLCRYTNEKAVAAIIRGWARARGYDV